MYDISYRYIDIKNGWYGFSTKLKQTENYNPSLLISPTKKVLQLRVNDSTDNTINRLFEYSLNLVNEYTYKN